MEDAEVRRLIAAGENFTVEFKRGTHGTLSDSDIVETVACLANGRGGHLLLGVEDDGTVTGTSPRHQKSTNPDLLRAMILNKTDPALSCGVTVHALTEGDVVAIAVPDEPGPVGTAGGVFKRRSVRRDGTPECIPYRAHEIGASALLAQGRDYAEVAAHGVTPADLDAAEFERFRSFARSRGGDGALSEAGDEEIARAVRATMLDSRGNPYVTLGGVLLFGTPALLARHVPTAELLFQEINGRGEITTNLTIRAPLLGAAVQVEQLMAARNPEQELMIGLQRVGVPRVPTSVVREAVANALVHRSYAELGPVHVQLGADEFVVASPGAFPPGVMLGNLLDATRPRSPLLADAFKRAGLVDRAGRGVVQMYNAMLRSGRRTPDYTRSTDASVTVVTATSDADLDLVRFILAWEDDRQTPLPMIQLGILHALKALGPMDLHELGETISSERMVLKSNATRLVEVGLVDFAGVGMSREYRLSAAFYDVAQDRNAYIRLSQSEPAHQEEVVLRYVDQFGAITRGQVMDLCLVTESRARGILRRLLASGAVELWGGAPGGALRETGRWLTGVRHDPPSASGCWTATSSAP